ncbi:GNAT family N-acetyltransferase [Chengkuizengella axinellae]|uniref:GNAT family N-acetyltransferase n=1 Tax=Chengkuizengella axinellae TaxID=3064388 RepID=A0ABT9J5A8_9BACL|nr:GNAT family N-acetyltransferase [Chengkuizengella sp. 2205SS18-9]MDP5276647.1 GNAT family N-acetyltransferase [Chengkuizengella sp. 2205SS18-9]
MEKKKWIIRKATVDDAKSLSECMISAYSKYLTRLNGANLPPMTIDYEKEISSYPVWVIESGKEIAGGLILMFENQRTTIANIAVHPDFQGKGLGKSLMNFAEAEAKRRGYTELSLATHILLTENISYYLNLGWEEIDRDDTRVYMRKYIN